MDETNVIITDQPIVNIAMPVEEPVITQDTNSATLSPSSTQNVDKSEEIKVVTLENGQVVKYKSKPPTEEEVKKIVEEEAKTEEKHAGRPCSFCPKHEEIMKKIALYVEYCRGNLDKHVHIPYIEELCGYDYMDMAVDTLEDWQKNTHEMPHDPNHKGEFHAELSRTIKKMFTRQKLFLLRRTLSTDGQVAGAIFQLKANHGMIETEKRLLGQDKDSEPIQITIVEEEKKYVA